MEDIEAKINSLIEKFFSQEKQDFIPGKTPILTGMAVYNQREINSILHSLLRGWFGLGEKGEEFEKLFSEFINNKYSAFVNSGSSANLLALESVKSQRNLDYGEIIIPAFVFPTTLNPIIQLGFTPHFIDVDKTMNPNPELIERAINRHTLGVFFSHNLGNPAKVSEISDLCREKGLFLLEDCCDALGSKYQGKLCGSFGDISTFSFYPAHMITTGEGGMVSTNDFELIRTIKSLRDWGRDCWCRTDEKNLFGACKNRFDFKINGVPYDHRYAFSKIGYNLKPLELQAAMGIEQLSRIEDFAKSRKRNFEIYTREFESMQDFFELPKINPYAEPVFFGFPLTINYNKINRQELLKFLNENKIATRLFFGGNIIYQPAYKKIKYLQTGELKNTDNFFENSFWIGIHPGISEEMINYIGSKFKEYLTLK